MLLGHYGVAFAAKRAAPRTSLGWLTFAAQWLDELWPVLLLMGVEQVRVEPGLMAASPMNFTHYPISHSLLTAALWGAAIAAGYALFTRRREGTLLIGALVVSHWLLDLPMHRPDLPLTPGSDVKVGLGLWNSVAGTIIAELTLFLGGLVVYARQTVATDRIGRWGLVAMVATLLLIFAGGFAGPPPTDVTALATFGLGLWLFIPWSWWVDRHRAPRAVA